MKRFTLAFLFCVSSISCFAQTANEEKIVTSYYSGFEKHDWNKVAAQLNSNFTFTSPNNDDHISLAKFREKCWGTSKFFKKVNLIKMAKVGNDLFLLVEIQTTDGKIVRNVDLFTFSAGKIRSIETFFGPGAYFPGKH